MITIGIPKITKKNKKARLSVEVEINNVIKELWLEVDDKYERFLVKDRCDAFVIALLPIAIREKKELVCLSPVSEELLHNLRTHLIPTLAKNGKNFYKSRISADVKKNPVNGAGAVGTGMVFGVDSMHVLSKYSDSEYPTLNLTHLCIHDTGAFDIPAYNEGGRNGEEIKNNLTRKCLKLCEEMDIDCVFTRSNLSKDFNLQYGINHMYCNLFPIFAMQKLFKLYYYGSSGLDFANFSLESCDRYECGRYELLLAYALSLSNLKIFVEGGEKNRLEKIEEIIHFSPAQKYLNPCMTGSENCNVCRKCMSTLLALDSLNRLDYFSNVFDVEYYKQNRKKYYAYMDKCHESGDKFMESIYQRFKKRKMTVDSNPETYVDGIVMPDNINTSALIIKSLKLNKVLMQKQIKESYSAVAFSKIMTAILALECGNTQMLIEFADSPIMGLVSATVYDLVNILMITQNNTAATLLAEAVGGSVSEFVNLMNQKAQQIGAKNTYFTSPTGLGAESRITAEDAAILLTYVLNNKHFCQIYGRRSYRIANDANSKQFTTTNLILKENSQYYIPECLGVKFGIRGNSANVAAVVQKNDDLYIAVLLGIKETQDSQNRYEDTKSLLRALLDVDIEK